MISYGGEAIDNYGIVRDFPARSMLTGLLGNALGLDRTDAHALDALQERLVHAAALVRPGRRSREYQTALLFENDAGWTTHGVPEGRAKSPSFKPDEAFARARGESVRKSLTHQRFRDYDADACALIALTLTPDDAGPTLDDIAAALDRPERPLFIGRKAQLPSRPVLHGRVTADDALAAIIIAVDGFVSETDRRTMPIRVQWHDRGATALGSVSPVGNGAFELWATKRVRVADERRHVSGVHGGTRATLEGELFAVVPANATGTP